MISFTDNAKKIAKRIETRISNYPFYWHIAPYFYNFIYHHDVNEYDAPCDPYKIEWVDPSKIQEITRRKRPLKYDVFGQVKSGDWDTRNQFYFNGEYNQEYIKYKYPTMDFDNSVFFISLFNHFHDNVPWIETNYVQNELSRISQGKSGWGDSRSKSELLEYCADVDELYYSIRDDGYKTQEQLGHTDNLIDARRNEIMVDVGRNGKLLYVDSRHRLAIAKILELEKVPVVFGVRHADWMRLRDVHYENKNTCIHPDLRDLNVRRHYTL